jgi:murein DD-endopeptidase MepM/ murein hydrolase activator NlpD
LPGEDVNITRTSPADISSAMAQDHTDSGRGFGAFRPHQGANGTWHWGLDLVQSPSDDVGVVAPEHSTCVEVWLNNTTAPFVGYGPGGVLLKGDSGVYHLLGHLDPSAWSQTSRPTIGQVYERGQWVGHTAPTGSDGVGSATPHVHWEVRVQPIDSPSTRKGNTLDPIDWTHGRATSLTGNVLTQVPSKKAGGFPWWILLLLAVASKRRR